MVVFRLFEKLRYSNKEENGKTVALQISLKIESLYLNFVTFARLPFGQFLAEKS